MSDTPQNRQNNAFSSTPSDFAKSNDLQSEADNLMLQLLQIPDAPVPTPPAAGPSPLDSLKPFPFHKGCGGMVQVKLGTDDDENLVAHVKCAKCGFEDYVQIQPVADDGAYVPFPEWVSPPNV